MSDERRAEIETAYERGYRTALDDARVRDARGDDEGPTISEREFWTGFRSPQGEDHEVRRDIGRNAPLRERIADELAHNDECGSGPVSWQEYLADADAILRIVGEASPSCDGTVAVEDVAHGCDVRADYAPAWPKRSPKSSC